MSTTRNDPVPSNGLTPNPRGQPNNKIASDPVTMLLSGQAAKANELWTCADWTKLCEHLHNDNHVTAFVMGFRSSDGEKKYVRSKRKSARQAISWSWATLEGKSKSKLAFVPYSTNERQQSRWGAMDFDAHHDGEADRARQFAFAAFRCLLNRPDLFVILETSGSGGFHVWAIAKEFRAIGDWIRLLKRVAQTIGAPITAGICEIFPPDTLPSRFGKGMRAPGCWNPGTDTFSEIFWENCEPLISSLSGKSKTGPLQTRDLQRDFPDKEKETSFTSPSDTPTELYKQEQWLRSFAITTARSRNDRLAALTGEIFHQVGYTTARRLVEGQFTQKIVATKATLAEHLLSFGLLWSGLEERWQANVSQAERQALTRLDTDNERDAFRIIRSFALKAQQDGAPDFPIARDNLGSRLGITGKGAAGIREKFIRLGIIQRTQRYQPNRMATRCKWLLHESNTIST